MGVVFTESRALPPEIRRMGHYRGFGEQMNTESAVADVFRSLTQGAVEWFHPEVRTTANQAAAAQAQAQLYTAQAYEEGQTKRTLIYVGAGLAGLVVLASIVKAANRPRLSGYRRKKRSRR